MELGILTVLGCIVGNVVGDCPEPAPVVNAYRTLHGNTNGSVVEYRCYDSFDHLSGNLKRTCQSDGTYDGEPPSCILNCGVPRNIAGTTKIYSKTTWESTVRYRCLENYTQEDHPSNYEGPCTAHRETWSKRPYRCGAPDNLLNYGGTPHQSSGIATTIETLIDGDDATCTTTDAALTSSWTVIINSEILYDFHRIKIRLGNTTATPIRVSVTGIRSLSWTKFKACDTLTTAINTNDWLQFSCYEWSHGHGIIVRATLETPAPLVICEVQVYGRVRRIDCENTPFIYGAASNITSANYNDLSYYKCVDGFTHIGGSDYSTCWNFWWDQDIRFICFDGHKANISSEVAVLIDNDIDTCQLMSWISLQVNEPLELHSVTILGPPDWTDIEVSIVISSLSVYQSNKSCQYDLSHNKNLGRNRNKPWTFYCPQQPVGDSMVVIIQSELTNSVNICDVIVWGRPISQHYEVFECLQTPNGHDYKGNVNTTVSGKICQPWLHALNQINEFPDFNMADTNNYCRNPNGLRNGPWCYTSPDYNQWEYCPILLCDKMCKTERDGSNYSGTKSLTIDGSTCIDWKSANQPYPPIMTENNYMNYCRNPGRSQSEPWCFINNNPTDNYKHCSIPDCPTTLSIGNLHLTVNEVRNHDYQFEDCWQSIDENTIMELSELNIGRDINTLCINNITIVNLWCYNLDGGNKWLAVTVVCDNTLGLTTDVTKSALTPVTYRESQSTVATATPVTVISTGGDQSTAAVTTSGTLTSSGGNLSSVAVTTPQTGEGQPSAVVTTSGFIGSTVESQSTATVTIPQTTSIETPDSSSTNTAQASKVKSIKASGKYPTQNINGWTTTDNTMTTSSDLSSITGYHLCGCQCINKNFKKIPNATANAIKELVNKINVALLLDIKTLSAEKQKYMSRIDNRTSVICVGTGAVGLFLTPLLLIIMFDLLNFITFLKSKYHGEKLQS